MQLPGVPPNALLNREVRVTLRDGRTFCLLALYLIILSLVAAYQFPRSATIEVGNRADEGENLFYSLVCGQAILVAILFPALAAGSIGREREQGTLEALLLTPLSPTQIVVGKAGGVFALAALLLFSTLPLASVSFLLGGVSPQEVLGYYSALFLMAALSTIWSINCALQANSAVRGTVHAYLQLPVLFALMSCCGLYLGGAAGGMYLLVLAFRASVAQWYAWSEGRRPADTWLKKALAYAWLLGLLAMLCWITLFDGWGFAGILAFFVGVVLISGIAVWVLAITGITSGGGFTRSHWRKDTWSFALGVQWTFGIAAMYYMARGWGSDLSIIFWMLASLAGYGTFACMVMNYPLRQAAKALEQHRDPELSPRARMDSQLRLISVPAVPRLNFNDSGRPEGTYYHREWVRVVPKSTYDVCNFLPEKLNPIHARELRSGSMSGGRNLEWAYHAVAIAIALETVWWFFFVPGTTIGESHGTLDSFAEFHLFFLMAAASWFGARAVAPERERQTLAQLAILPLPASSIIGGKLLSILTYTSLVMAAGVPLPLILGSVEGIATPASVLCYLAIEIASGCCAAAWGLYCSVRNARTSGALGWAIGGVVALQFTGQFLPGLLGTNYGVWYPGPSSGPTIADSLIPTWAMHCAILLPFGGNAAAGTLPSLLVVAMSCVLYGGGALLLLWRGTKAFERLVSSL